MTTYRLERASTPALLTVVADGIGGHRAGEIASQMTVDTFVQQLAAADGKQPVEQLRAAVVETDRLVSQAAQQDLEREGMGSTLAAAWIIGPRLFTASVGDSRIYLLRRGALRQISVDHTWVQEAIAYEIIRPDQAKEHPQAHVLRRHIGGAQPVEPDLRLVMQDGESDEKALANQGITLQQDDRLLLCTDGLTDLVEDGELQAVMGEYEPKEAVNTLLQLACERGGHDNITLVILHVPAAAGGRRPTHRRTWILLTALSILILVTLLSATAVALWWLGWWPWAPHP